MKSLQLLLLLPLFNFACKEKENANDKAGPFVIGKGNMPAITKDVNNDIHVVYGYGDSIMYANSSDAGKTFNSPELVDTLSELVDFATRGPQVVCTCKGPVLIAVNKAGDIFSYTKNTSGKWLRTAKVNDADTTNREGFLALSSDGDSTLFAIWPDLRNDGHNKVYGARSTDGGQTWGGNILIYRSPEGTICECCRQSVVMEGPHVYVMFRNFIQGNRDLYLIESDDGGQTFGGAQKLGNGSWQLDGCPMDGGGLALADGNIQTVWRRRDSIFYAVPGKAEEFITTGKGCNIAADRNEKVIAWTNDGNIYYKPNEKDAQLIGKGNSVAMQMINDKQVICVWHNDGNISCGVLNL